MSEKIRAAIAALQNPRSSRSLASGNIAFDRDLTRSLAVIKLWESDKENLDYNHFTKQIEDGKDYDLNDLKNLLRNDQASLLKTDYRFWTTRTTAGSGKRPILKEKELRRTASGPRKAEVATLKAEAIKRAK